MTERIDHFRQGKGDIWYGGSFAYLRFSTFLKIVESRPCDGRILIDWEEKYNSESLPGLATIIFSGGKFTNAYFKIAYMEKIALDKMPALEALLRRVWGIGFDYQIQGNYGFECHHDISRVYTPDFSLNTQLINAIVTELQEMHVSS